MTVSMLMVVGCSASVDEPSATVEHSPGAADDQFTATMKDCLAEAGYDVTVYDDGSFGIRLPEAQMAGYDAASHKCSEDHGYGQPPEMTDEQLRHLYAATVDLVSCLETHGYPITDVPSEQAFLDGTPFVPYEQVPLDVVGEEWDKLVQDCPQP